MEGYIKLLANHLPRSNNIIKVHNRPENLLYQSIRFYCNSLHDPSVAIVFIIVIVFILVIVMILAIVALFAIVAIIIIIVIVIIAIVVIVECNGRHLEN